MGAIKGQNKKDVKNLFSFPNETASQSKVEDTNKGKTHPVERVVDDTKQTASTQALEEKAKESPEKEEDTSTESLEQSFEANNRSQEDPLDMTKLGIIIGGTFVLCFIVSELVAH